MSREERMVAASHEIIWSHDSGGTADVSVCISLFNYQNYIVGALESVRNQTLHALDLLIVDDCSTDRSLDIAADWLRRHGARFTRAALVRHAKNSGLATARNTAFALTRTPYVFVLDADNELYPRCVEECWLALQDSDAAFAYPILEKFDSARGLMGTDLWSKARLAKANYIDAMTLLRKSAWESVGGYTKMDSGSGWEDYELWCKLVDRGAYGVQVPQILARYRVHGSSMLRTHTNSDAIAPKLREEMRRRHPWLTI
jgi:glycosyltransferase involved in cell wall biosynthesis